MQNKKLEALKILVAEDDKVNQAVIKSILKKLGCSFTVVENGVQALETLTDSSFDLILMDIEMPELDGCDTTLKIRSSFAPPKSTIPIISTTAHVNDQDIKRCMDVGMNDYLVKPINIYELVKKIETLVKGVDVTDFRTPVNATSPIENVFQFSNLTTACGNNPAIAKNIIKLFLAQSPQNMEQLKSFLEAEDWINYKNLCHKMKASYALLGFVDIKKQLQEMEDDVSRNNINVTKFKSYLSQLIVANDAFKKVLEDALKV